MKKGTGAVRCYTLPPLHPFGCLVEIHPLAHHHHVEGRGRSISPNLIPILREHGPKAGFGSQSQGIRDSEQGENVLKSEPHHLSGSLGILTRGHIVAPNQSAARNADRPQRESPCEEPTALRGNHTDIAPMVDLDLHPVGGGQALNLDRHRGGYPLVLGRIHVGADCGRTSCRRHGWQSQHRDQNPEQHSETDEPLHEPRH